MRLQLGRVLEVLVTNAAVVALSGRAVASVSLLARHRNVLVAGRTEPLRLHRARCHDSFVVEVSQVISITTTYPILMIRMMIMMAFWTTWIYLQEILQMEQPHLFPNHLLFKIQLMAV